MGDAPTFKALGRRCAARSGKGIGRSTIQVEEPNPIYVPDLKGEQFRIDVSTTETREVRTWVYSVDSQSSTGPLRVG